MEWSKKGIPISSSLTNELNAQIVYNSERIDELIDKGLKQAIMVVIRNGSEHKSAPHEEVSLLRSQLTGEECVVAADNLTPHNVQYTDTAAIADATPIETNDLAPPEKRARHASADASSMITPPFSPAVAGAFAYPMTCEQQVIYVDAATAEAFTQQQMVNGYAYPVAIDATEQQLSELASEDIENNLQTDSTDIGTMIGSLLFDCLDNSSVN